MISILSEICSISSGSGDAVGEMEAARRESTEGPIIERREIRGEPPGAKAFSEVCAVAVSLLAEVSIGSGRTSQTRIFSFAETTPIVAIINTPEEHACVLLSFSFVLDTIFA